MRARLLLSLHGCKYLGRKLMALLGFRTRRDVFGNTYTYKFDYIYPLGHAMSCRRSWLPRMCPEQARLSVALTEWFGFSYDDIGPVIKFIFMPCASSLGWQTTWVLSWKRWTTCTMTLRRNKRPLCQWIQPSRLSSNMGKGKCHNLIEHGFQWKTSLCWGLSFTKRWYFFQRISCSL